MGLVMLGSIKRLLVLVNPFRINLLWLHRGSEMSPYIVYAFPPVTSVTRAWWLIQRSAGMHPAFAAEGFRKLTAFVDASGPAAAAELYAIGCRLRRRHHRAATLPQDVAVGYCADRGNNTAAFDPETSLAGWCRSALQRSCRDPALSAAIASISSDAFMELLMVARGSLDELSEEVMDVLADSFVNRKTTESVIELVGELAEELGVGKMHRQAFCARFYPRYRAIMDVLCTAADYLEEQVNLTRFVTFEKVEADDHAVWTRAFETQQNQSCVGAARRWTPSLPPLDAVIEQRKNDAASFAQSMGLPTLGSTSSEVAEGLPSSWHGRALRWSLKHDFDVYSATLTVVIDSERTLALENVIVLSKEGRCRARIQLERVSKPQVSSADLWDSLLRQSSNSGPPGDIF